MSNYSTLGTLRTRVRSYLRESSANEWADVDINQHINDEHRDLYDEMAQILAQGWGRSEASFTLPANTEVFDASTLTGIFGEINSLYHLRPDNVLQACEKVLPGQENRLNYQGRLVGTIITPMYWVERSAQTETIHLLPLASSPRNFIIKQTPVVPDLLTDTDLLWTPSRYDNLLARRSQRSCLVDVEDESESVEREIMRLTARMEDRESQGVDRDKWEAMNTDQGDRAFQTWRDGYRGGYGV